MLMEGGGGRDLLFSKISSGSGHWSEWIIWFALIDVEQVEVANGAVSLLRL